MSKNMKSIITAILFSSVLCFSSISPAFATMEDFENFNPTFDDSILTLDYTKSVGQLFDGENSSAIAVTATSDGGYVVLVSSGESCPESGRGESSDSISSAPLSTKKSAKKPAKANTSNKFNEVDRYFNGCAAVVKYTASGNEVWRTNALRYASGKDESGIYYDYLEGDEVAAFTQTDKGIVLLTRLAYILISDDGSVEYAKSLCYGLNEIDYNEEGAGRLAEQLEVFCEEATERIQYGNYVIIENDGTITTLFYNYECDEAGNNCIDYTTLANVSPSGDYNWQVNLDRVTNEQLGIEHLIDIEGGIYKTIDGYIIGEDGRIFHLSEDLQTINLLIDDNKCNGSSRMLLIDNEGNIFVGNCRYYDIPRENRHANSAGWQLDNEFHVVFDKNGNELNEIPAEMNRENTAGGYGEFGLYAFEAGLGLGQNRWLLAAYMGEGEEADGLGNEMMFEGLAYINGNEQSYDGIPMEREGTSYQTEPWMVLSENTYYWSEPSDATVLNDGSIIAVGSEWYGHEGNADEEPGKHYDITCANGQSYCSNIIIKRYLVNNQKIEIVESINGTTVTDLEDNSSVAQDTRVQLTITPNAGYKVKQITVTAADGTEIPVTDNSFIMPGMNVAVSVEYEFVLANPSTADNIVVFGVLGTVSLIIASYICSKTKNLRKVQK